MVSGIIFDLDGLMIDSESLAMQAWNDLLAPSGIQLSEEDYRPLIGLSHAESIKHVLGMTNLDIPHSSLDQGFWQRMMELIEEDLQPRPGLIPLLDQLRGMQLALGVASNSPVRYVKKALEETKVDSYFTCVRGVDQVPNPKPAPDVYLAAAACLRVAPEECLAIEDSLSGVHAALDAGMTCLLVPSQVEEMNIPAGVTDVFPTLAELHAEIEEILKGL